jgi:hypothetical protein
MEPTSGIEPEDLFLTKEALYRLSYVGNRTIFGLFWSKALQGPEDELGAGDEARTRDNQLGRLKLYQLSYSRPVSLIKLASEHSHPHASCIALVGAAMHWALAGSHVVRNESEKRISYIEHNSNEWWWGEDSNLRRL